MIYTNAFQGNSAKIFLTIFIIFCFLFIFYYIYKIGSTPVDNAYDTI